ncbi:peptide/nickel transport system permease protein [Arboricoccus pini]|uniref:Peptide/nickel transport system permease protein n=1 Tax=Arboricoccus pini TaxID=1963835 RepID=A0A212R851_9PROT|nr:ABC transporter permease [Arboricoccus pini]SNB68319.1 peptide/nickel transport system permease protein [Arboricoccus pini]
MNNARSWLLADQPASPLQARMGRFYTSWLALSANPLALIGLAIVVLLLLSALLAPWIAPRDAVYVQNLDGRLQPPSLLHWFGTDELGRDLFARVVHGSRITLMIVALVAIIVGPLGLIIGMVAGYVGGWTDRILMRLTDIFLAFPRLVLALAFVAALRPGIESAILAIAITSWPPYARLARAETLMIRRSDFIAAAIAQGASAPRIIRRYVMPLCMPSVVIRLTLDMAGIILTAAGLGFLGLGAQPPSPEWGAMVAAGRGYVLDQWWVSTIPGIAILLVSLGFNLLGDGLRDALDPRQS